MGTIKNQKGKGERELKGQVKRIFHDRNFGYIAGEDNKDYFFNAESMKNNDFQNVKNGDSVSFDVKPQPGKREDKAINCVILDHPLIEFFKENALQFSDLNNYDEFCDNAKAYATRLSGSKVTTSMIRKVYSRIINATKISEVKLLRPQFAYIAGRNEGNAVLREFMDLLDYLVKKMDPSNNQQLKNFKDFMEAIVAYRKYVGDDK